MTDKTLEAYNETRRAYNAKHYMAMPYAEWDGIAPLYSRTAQRYFASPEDARADMVKGASLEYMALVLCEPVRAVITLDDFENILPDKAQDLEGECPELIEAIAAFNKTMSAVAISWTPGGFRLKGE